MFVDTRRRAAMAWLAVSAAGLALAGCDRDGGRPAAAAFRNTDVTGADFGKGFSLVDHEGRPRTLEDFRGKVVTLFFGFTQCPDVCPTSLAEMAEAMKAMGPKADQVQVLFVTVDPARDTPALLKEYVPSFDPRFVGLTGSPEQITQVAKDFRVFYQKVPGKTPDSYTIDHTAGTYVFDREGRLRLFVKHGQGAEALAHDLSILVDAPRA